MLKSVYKSNLIWRLIASLLVTLIILIIQMKLQSYLPNTQFLLLSPAIIIIAWLDFAGALAGLFFTLIFFFTISPAALEKSNMVYLVAYAVSSLSFTWLIQFIKKHPFLFAQQVRPHPQQLYSIVENMQDSFFVVDKDWSIKYVNRNHEKLTGLKKLDLLGKNLWEAFPIQDSQASTIRSELEKVMSKETQTVFEEYCAPLKLWLEICARKTQEGGVAVFYRDITQRKLQEESMRSDEKRFRALADSMPQIVFISNRLGRVIYFNKQWHEYTGLRDIRDFFNQFENYIHADDFQNVLSRWKSAVEGGDKFSIECRLKSKDGLYRWHLVRSVAIRQENGQIENWFGTSTDIHDLKCAREEVKIHEEKFETMANNIPQMAWMSDGDGLVSWYNQRWVDYTGYSCEELKTWYQKQVHHPQHIERVEKGFQRHLISGKPWEDIFPIKGKDGQYRWFLSRAIPIRNSYGKIIKWFGTNTDIDEQVKIEAMLNESHMHFRQLANSIPHIIWTSGRKGEIDFYNQRFHEYTGISEQEDLLQSWQGLIHPDDFDEMVKRWTHSLVSGDPYQIEYRLKDKRGNYRWFLGRALPIYDQNGVIVKWFGSCTDIEESKHLSEQLEQQKKELECALVTRDEFLSIASHELKTPLTSLKLHCQFYRRAMALKNESAFTPEKIINLCNQIDKQVGKLNRLVDDMLDISRIRTGKLTLRPQEFHLPELISEVIHTLRDQFKSSGCPMPSVEYTHATQKDLMNVKWDRVRMEQVLSNLLTNTIRYGNNNPVLLTLSQSEDSIHLAVKDNGIGIAPENIEKIFYRFEKIQNPKEVAGLGLGLFITKQIVEAHGGKIWVESQLGVGSVFNIEMPC